MTNQVNTPATSEEMQSALVDALVTDGLSVEDAAIKAGYSNKRSALNALRRSNMQEAVVAATSVRARTLAPVALRALERLVTSGKSEKVRADAAWMLLRLAGMAEQEQKGAPRIGSVTINVSMKRRGEAQKSGNSESHPHPLPQNVQKTCEDAEIVPEGDVGYVSVGLSEEGSS